MSVTLDNPEAVGPAAKPPRKKRVTERQLAANRANAQKCTGPKTPEGKACTRFNGLKHGLCAANVCLPGEDDEEYERRRRAYVDFYQPASLIEWDLVEDLVAARWRKNRIIKVEQNLILDTILRERINIEKHYYELSLDAETALAMRNLIDESDAMRLLDRYETRAQLNIIGTMRMIENAQLNRPPAQDGPPLNLEWDGFCEAESELSSLPTETIPTTEHPAPAPVGNATSPSTIVPKPKQTPNPAPAATLFFEAPQTYVGPLGAPLPAVSHEPLTAGHGA
jgi:hypothetical protein